MNVSYTRYWLDVIQFYIYFTKRLCNRCKWKPCKTFIGLQHLQKSFSTMLHEDEMRTTALELERLRKSMKNHQCASHNFKEVSPEYNLDPS
jgi:hypothetical protein